MKKNSFVLDAIILCIITLVLGAVLAGVYTITKAPIEQAQKKADDEACQVVIKDIQSAKVADADASEVDNANAFMEKNQLNAAAGSVENPEDPYSNYVIIDTVKKIVVDNQVRGNVYIAKARKGYGGNISFVIGVCDKTISGIEITEQSETAGLGANCESDEYKGRYAYSNGISYPSDDTLPMYYKAGTSPSEEGKQIEAMSGATVTSRAIANAVKGILLYDKQKGVDIIE